MYFLCGLFILIMKGSRMLFCIIGLEFISLGIFTACLYYSFMVFLIIITMSVTGSVLGLVITSLLINYQGMDMSPLWHFSLNLSRWSYKPKMKRCLYIKTITMGVVGM